MKCPIYYFLDLDECVTESPCHENATCNNTIGSYLCECNDGYTGNGTYCTGTCELNSGIKHSFPPPFSALESQRTYIIT